MADKTFTASTFGEYDWDSIKAHVDASADHAKITAVTGSIKYESINGRNIVYDFSGPFIGIPSDPNQILKNLSINELKNKIATLHSKSEKNSFTNTEENISVFQIVISTTSVTSMTITQE